MKKYFISRSIVALSLFLTALHFNTHAQTLDRYILSAAGANLKNDNYSMHFTIGEPIAGTFDKGLVLNQGFEQEWAIVTAVDPVNENWDVNVYPNPTPGSLFVDAEVMMNISIIDAQGKTQLVLKNHSGSEPIDVSGFSAGSYFIVLRHLAERKVKMFKFIKL